MIGSDVTTSMEAPILLDLLPVGVAVIDVYGILRFANARMLAMTGFTRDDVVGRSVLDFVASEEFSNATHILTAGRGFIGRTMGPIRLRYRGADGQLRATEMWAQNCLDVAGIDGYVATFAEESVEARPPVLALRVDLERRSARADAAGGHRLDGGASDGGHRGPWRCRGLTACRSSVSGRCLGTSSRSTIRWRHRRSR